MDLRPLQFCAISFNLCKRTSQFHSQFMCLCERGVWKLLILHWLDAPSQFHWRFSAFCGGRRGGICFRAGNRKSQRGTPDSRQRFKKILHNCGYRSIALSGPNPCSAVRIVGDGYGNVSHDFAVRDCGGLFPAPRPLLISLRQQRVIICNHLRWGRN